MGSMDPAEAAVRRFMAPFHDGWPDDLAAHARLLADEVSWQMIVPLAPPLHGRDAVVRSWEAMRAVGLQRHDIVSVASNGRVVFTERVDHFEVGGTWGSMPIVEVFEVDDDGRIGAWRGYMDAGSVAEQYGQTYAEFRDQLLASFTV